MTVSDDVDRQARAEPDRSGIIALGLGSREWADRLAAARAARAEALAAKDADPEALKSNEATAPSDGGPEAPESPAPPPADAAGAPLSNVQEPEAGPQTRKSRQTPPKHAVLLLAAFVTGIGVGAVLVVWLTASDLQHPAAPREDAGASDGRASPAPGLARRADAPEARLRPTAGTPPTATESSPASMAPAAGPPSLASQQVAPKATAPGASQAPPTVAPRQAPFSPEGQRAALQASAEAKLAAPSDARPPEAKIASASSARVVNAESQAPIVTSRDAAIQRLKLRRAAVAAVRLLAHRPGEAATPVPELAEAGLTVEVRPSSSFAPAAPLFQYFSPEDAAFAADIAAIFDGDVIDLSRFRPAPPDRRIEIYLRD